MNKAFLILGITLAISCAKKEEDTEPVNPLAGAVPCDNIHTDRVGAQCVDGTQSKATGSGACSHHGGVKYWLCK